MINNTSEPTDKNNIKKINKNYQKMKTQQNPTINYLNYGIAQKPNTNIIDNNPNEEDIIYNTQNEIGYTQIPQTTQIPKQNTNNNYYPQSNQSQQNMVNQDYSNHNQKQKLDYTPAAGTNRVRHDIIDRQNNTKNKTDPRYSKGKK